MAIGFHFTIKSISTGRVDNYLYLGQYNLKNHLLTVDQTTKEKILFLGSSAVAGNRIPIQTTLIDYFNQQNPQYQAYNLAAFQMNLLDANIILNSFKNKLPKLAILGIDPSVLSANQSSLFSKSHSASAIPELKLKMNDMLNSSLQDKIELLLHRDPEPPSNFQLWWKSLLVNLKNRFWGSVFNKQIYGTERKMLPAINSESNPSWILIDTFIKTAKNSNILPVIIIEPILNSTYPKEEFDIFKARMKKKSEVLNFTLFDYSSTLPSTHDFFSDFVHLTPVGYETLATKLKEDLIKNNIIKGLNP